jgi:hypothetical protein
MHQSSRCLIVQHSSSDSAIGGGPGKLEKDGKLGGFIRHCSSPAGIRDQVADVRWSVARWSKDGRDAIVNI